MKILFVCRQNVGRSQMAKAFYNSMTQTDDADAAGTNVNEIGQTLQERKSKTESANFFIIDVMNDVNINIAEYTRNSVTADVLSKFDKIISMTDEKDTPKWLI